VKAVKAKGKGVINDGDGYDEYGSSEDKYDHSSFEEKKIGRKSSSSHGTSSWYLSLCHCEGRGD